MMSEEPYFKLGRRAQLRSWVAGEMLRGAGKALFWATVVIVVLYGVWGIGQMLPDASKEAPPPMGALQIAAPTRLA